MYIHITYYYYYYILLLLLFYYYFVSLQVFGPFTMSFVVSVWLCFPPRTPCRCHLYRFEMSKRCAIAKLVDRYVI